MLPSRLLVLVSGGIASHALPAAQGSRQFDYSFSTLQTVPGTQNLENLASRYNGDILVTSVTSNVLHQVSHDNSTPPIAVAEFPALGLLGIAEIEPDVFYVVGSNISVTAVAPGTNRVWRVDMTSFTSSSNGSVPEPASTSLVARLPDAGTLNGMTTFDKDHVLIADAQLGIVTKLNVHTGHYWTFANDSTMDPLSTDDGYLGVGINGLHIFDDKLYYTSLDQGLFASIDLNCPSEPAEVIATDIAFGDDFALTADGKTAFIANNGEFTLTEVDIPAKSTRLVNSTVLQAASSAAFGKIEKLLYVTGEASLGGNETVGSVFVGVPVY